MDRPVSNSGVVREVKNRLSQTVPLLLAVLVAGSMWFYVERIMVPVQASDAAAHSRPRGNLSDLYPRWLGTRELLLRHRNPYGHEITVEVQRGYYGRELDASRPNDPKDQQAFAYPVYVVFLLAPLISFPFHSVQLVFYWALIALTILTVLLWMAAVGYAIKPLSVVIAALLCLGSFPVVQGLKLQQLTLLVAGFLALSLFFLIRRRFLAAGILLALTTIKPQLAWPIVAWILLWAFSDWKARRNVIFGFGSLMAALLIGSEIVLPGWLHLFLTALQEYREYTHNVSVFAMLVNWATGSFGGYALPAASVAVTFYCLWRFRTLAADTPEFRQSLALILSLTVLIVPMFAPYNQILLLAPILWLWQQRNSLKSDSGVTRALYPATLVAIIWPWIASMALTILCFVSRDLALQLWQVPLYSSLALPILVFALTLLSSLHQRSILRFQAAAE